MSVTQEYALCAEYKKRIDELRPFPPETLRSLREYYRLGLTYSSNALEGNSLTESETRIVLEDGLTVSGKPLHDIYEAVGHAKAYDQLYEISRSEPLALADILTLHRLFYQQINPDAAGTIRTGQVFLSGSRYKLPLPGTLPQLLDEFIIWFNAAEKTLHPIEFAALAHQKFVFIHPFVDGNGRVARLLMNLALLRTGYEIAIIPPLLRSEYIAALEKAHRNPQTFCSFIAQRVIETQKDLLRLFGISTKLGTIKNGLPTLPAEDIFAYLTTHPGLNSLVLAEQLNIPPRTLRRHLKKLIDDGRVEFRGAPKNGGYHIVHKVPHATTLAAIEEAERMANDPNAKTYSSIEELMKALDE